MGTQTVLYVQTANIEPVVEHLSRWMERVHGKRIETRIADSVFDVYDCFLLPEENTIEAEFETTPTMVGVGHDQGGWVTVHHNTFFEMFEVGKGLSADLRCRAVSLNAQTVTDAWRLGIFESGERIRRVDWVGESGDWRLNEGKPLPFEAQPLGKNLGSEEDPFYVFGHHEVSEYCAHLDLRIWRDDFGSPWTILSIPGVGSNRRPRVEEKEPSFWAKFFRLKG